MHIFLDAGMGNVLAFFELPTQPDMGRDENTPKWVQHFAMKVKDRPTLEAAKAHLISKGVDVLGITNHGIFHSIYFFDPNGHRIELAYDDEKAAEKIARITEEMKIEMLNEWDTTKRAPHHTHFLHADELDASKACVEPFYGFRMKRLRSSLFFLFFGLVLEQAFILMLQAACKT